MDRAIGDPPRATFGPEWLSFSKDPPSAHFASSEDDLNSYNVAKSGSKAFHSSKKVPLRFTRSKSTPLLPNAEETEGGQIKEKVEGNAFKMLKERNSFDRNFPTLNTGKPRSIASPLTASPPPILNQPPNSSIVVNKPEWTSSGSAWKTSQSKPIPSNANFSSSPGTATSPSVREGMMETEIQLASCIVPNVQAPKVLTKNRVELLTKKGPMKQKFDKSLLRKATSEPNLPIPPAYQENYAKLMASRKVTADLHKEKKFPEKVKSGTVVLNRSDFFRGIVKKEQPPILHQEEFLVPAKLQHRRVYSDDQSGLIAYRAPSLVTPGEETLLISTPEKIASEISVITGEGKDNKESFEMDSANTSNSSSRSTSPKLLSPEDEEKFLRNLGWVPEEEDHVPELTDEEIFEEANKLRHWKIQISNQKRLSLEVSIKKWQDDVLFALR